jgi:predicted nucleic acid-binding protein
MVYVDSGVLIKLYVRERDSDKAAERLLSFPSLDLNRLHELEVRNSLRALEGRGLISQSQRLASEHLWEADFIASRLRRRLLDWDAVLEEAERLSALHTASTLARSLDILHVAAAIQWKVELFISGEARQIRIARLAGLRVEGLGGE